MNVFVNCIYERIEKGWRTMLGILISAVSEVLSVAAKVVTTALQVVGTNIIDFAKILEGFFKAAGLLDETESVENLGDRAIQAEEAGELDPEQFDSYEEYMKKVREFELDEERSKTITPEQKMEKGVELMTQLAVARYGEETGAGLVTMAAEHREYFSDGDKLSEIGKLTKDGEAEVADIVNYVGGRPQSTERDDAAFDALLRVEKNTAPEQSIEEAMRTILALRDKKEDE